MSYLNDIWQHIQPLIHWGVFVLVIVLGWIITSIPDKNRIFKKIPTGYKVVLIGLLVTIPYAVLEGVSAGMYILSFVGAMGTHTVFINHVEKWIRKKVRTIGGSIPPGDDEDQ